MSKVLIVEDEEFLADIYRIKFSAEGFEVTLAQNGREGYEQAKAIKPDLVFLDLLMPVMDGYQALDALRADPETKDLRVVILSNLGQEEEIADAMSRGADAFLIKANLTPNDLVIKAREMLSSERHPQAVNKPVLDAIIETPIERGPANGKTVLLIEDNKEIIQIYVLQLEKEGYAVEVAENGSWGLRRAREKHFDVIIMDMVMPAMSGWDMLKTIRHDSQNSMTPVIVVSNSAQEEEIEKVMEAGADKYYIKSDITPAELGQAIAALLAPGV
jgi:CheY-like chemotaxis protein